MKALLKKYLSKCDRGYPAEALRNRISEAKRPVYTFYSPERGPWNRKGVLLTVYVPGCHRSGGLFGIGMVAKGGGLGSADDILSGRFYGVTASMATSGREVEPAEEDAQRLIRRLLGSGYVATARLTGAFEAVGLPVPSTSTATPTPMSKPKTKTKTKTKPVIKYRLVKFERALAFQVLEQDEGSRSFTGSPPVFARSAANPELGVGMAFVRGSSSSEDLRLCHRGFRSNAERDDYAALLVAGIKKWADTYRASKAPAPKPVAPPKPVPDDFIGEA